jgi:small subunit ribosomal protein S6
MRRYELMLLLRPDLDDDKLQAAVEKVTRAIVNGGGSLTKVSPWGKRRLAYDIQHFREASYFLIHFDIEPSAVREIERGMLISEEIVRHLVTVLEERPGEQAAEAIEPDVELSAVDVAENGASAEAQVAEPVESASSDAEPEAPSAQAEQDEQPQDEQPQDEQPQVATSEA